MTDSRVHESAPLPLSPGINRQRGPLTAVLRGARRHRYAYLVLCVIWALAYNRVLFDHTPHTPLLFNWTGSLPYKVAWLNHAVTAFARGDFVIFTFAGAAQADYPGLRDQPFFKVIRGVPGDRVTVRGREVFVNGDNVGRAKTHTFDRRPLEPIVEGVIPPGYFYVQGTDVNSFDSRYRSSGLVRADQIIGRVTPLF